MFWATVDRWCKYNVNINSYYNHINENTTLIYFLVTLSKKNGVFCISCQQIPLNVTHWAFKGDRCNFISQLDVIVLRFCGLGFSPPVCRTSPFSSTFPYYLSTWSATSSSTSSSSLIGAHLSQQESQPV